MIEEWRPILSYEGLYSVSNLGQIRSERNRTSSKAGRLLKLTETRRGYRTVSLSLEGKESCCRVHRLVWEAFRGPLAPGLVVNHLDGVPGHNALANLEAVTVAENVRHAFRVLGRNPGATKLNATTAEEIRHLAADGATFASIGREFGVSITMVSAIVHGEQWRSAGGPTRPRTRRRAEPIPDEVVAATIKRARAGESPTALAREVGVSKRTIYNWLEGRTRC